MKEVLSLYEFITKLVIRMHDFYLYARDVQDVIPEQPGWGDWSVVLSGWLKEADRREQDTMAEDVGRGAVFQEAAGRIEKWFKIF